MKHWVIRLVIPAIAAVTPVVGDAWNLPTGIPRPSSGTDDWMYAGQPRYNDAGEGPYTHYTYGSDTWTGTFSSTPSQPIFVRGPARSLGSAAGRSSSPAVAGIGEQIDFTQSNIELVGSGSHHVVLVTATCTTIRARARSFQAALPAHIVIHTNEINNSDVIPSSADHHGIFAGLGTDYVWALDNPIHHISVHRIQFCHGCIGTGQGPAHVCIGRNVTHPDEENAMDIAAVNLGTTRRSAIHCLMRPRGKEGRQK